jgi:MFS transporter, YQGE family, putative transporter
MRSTPSYQTLNSSLRRLVLSNFLQAVSYPISNLFITVFIWRVSGSLVIVALYSIGACICLPLAFLLNGYLLRVWSIVRTFWLGAVLNGLATAAVVLLVSAKQPIEFFLYGCLWGLLCGFYWSSRNYLEFQETSDGVRQYYFGLLYSFGQIFDVVVPFLAGWFIVFAPNIGLFSSVHAYMILFAIAFAFMIAAAAVVSGGSFKTVAPYPVLRSWTGTFSNERRLVSIALGVVDGLNFLSLSGLIVLVFLGNEAVFGTIAALVALLTAAVMYAYGRLFNRRYQYQALVVSSGIFFACASILVFGPQPFGAAVYVLFAGIVNSFFGLTSSSTLLHLSSEEMAGNQHQRYSFIFDNELFLNIGRVVAMLVIIGIALGISQIAGLLDGIFLAGSIQFILLLVILVRRRIHFRV